MQLEVRRIDGEPFFVLRQGGREHIRTATEVIADARTKIRDAQARLAELVAEEKAARTSLEAAALEGEPTETQRQRLVAIHEETTRPRQAVTAAQRTIEHVHTVVDQNEAARIAAVGNGAIAAALQSLQIPENLRHA